MQTRRAFFLTLISTAVAAGWASAAGLSENDRATLAVLLEEWESAITAGDVDAFVRTMPPAVLKRIAELAGVPLDQFVEKAQALVGPLMMTDLASVGLKVSFDWSRSSFGETDSGRPYVIIPRVMKSDYMTVVTPVLAIRDDGEWYMVQVDNPMMRALVQQSYPDLASVDFSAFPDTTVTMQE